VAEDDLPSEVLRARTKWKYTGAVRPGFAVAPGPGRESVWDYPRPPRPAPDSRHVQVICEGVTIADTLRAIRVLETASPPTFYLAPDDINAEYLEASPRTSICEWKGPARYWSIRAGRTLLRDVAWSYPEPYPGFEQIAGYYSFYPGRVECWVDGKPVEPQPGGFYGGWVTPEIVGPFKGEPGTEWW